MDLAVWPERFGLGGPSSFIFVRQGLIRLSSEIDEAKHWIASFGIEQPDTNVTNGDGQTDWPDAVARVDVNHDWGHLMGALLVRQLKATSTSGTGTDTAFAWGLNLSGKLAVPGTADNLKFQVNQGAPLAGPNDILCLCREAPHSELPRFQLIHVGPVRLGSRVAIRSKG